MSTKNTKALATLKLIKRGLESGAIRAKPIMDMSDPNATEWPIIEVIDEVVAAITELEAKP